MLESGGGGRGGAENSVYFQGVMGGEVFSDFLHFCLRGGSESGTMVFARFYGGAAGSGMVRHCGAGVGVIALRERWIRLGGEQSWARLYLFTCPIPFMIDACLDRRNLNREDMTMTMKIQFATLPLLLLIAGCQPNAVFPAKLYDVEYGAATIASEWSAVSGVVHKEQQEKAAALVRSFPAFERVSDVCIKQGFTSTETTDVIQHTCWNNEGFGCMNGRAYQKWFCTGNRAVE